MKITLNWIKYLPKKHPKRKTGFQGVNKIVLLLFKNADGRESHKQYYLITLKIKDYNVMIDGRNFPDQPRKNDLKHMITLERLQLVKVMITQLDIY